MAPDWKAAYNILMDYWDCIPEEEKAIVDQKLCLVLDSYEHTTADSFNIGVEKGCNSPSKPLSGKIDRPPKDCIKNALKRLTDEYGFGIPDKKDVWKKDPVVLKALGEEFGSD